MTKVRDLQDDNIDLVQDNVAEFFKNAGYDNEDYNFAFIVWDKSRDGIIQKVYGSYSVDLDERAYECEETITRIIREREIKQ